MSAGADNDAKSTRVTVVYAGQVQGVGFRFTTVRIAAGHDVTGYVCNLPDGTVRLVAEGGENTLRAFLGEILQSSLGRHIRNEQANWGKATGEFSRFGVRQYDGS